MTHRTSVAVAVCTCDRNGPLAVLLDGLLENAARVAPRAALGVVVVDDSRDGGAREVVRRYEGRFELGLHYRVAGHQNISLARNLAIETAAGIAEWVAMTDDDCEPQSDWLERLLETQRRTAADAVAGNYRRRAPAGAPVWLTDEPFLEIALMSPAEGAALDMAGTNNSMIRAAWWKEHPQVRFDPTLGKAGGEDVVFYRTAHAAGLRIHAAPRAVVFEEQPPSRTTLRYQLWHFFWMGNSSFVTRRGTRQASPARMVLQGGNHMRRALARSLARVARGRRPHVRYCLASLLFGTGMMLGALGLRVSHH
jgi:glycosyltransferase involved in cell wall biosynthesis